MISKNLEDAIVSSGYESAKIILFIAKCELTNRPIPKPPEIAREIGVNRTSVWRWLKSNNFNMRTDANRCATDNFKNNNILSTHCEPQCNEIVTIEKRKTANFTKPTIEQITAFCKEKKLIMNPEAFYDHYESNGWKVGKNPMKSWKSSVRQWERSKYNEDYKLQHKAIPLDERRKAFGMSLKPYNNNPYTRAQLAEFMNYWGQKVQDKDLMRWECERVWELDIRLQQFNFTQ